MRISKRAGRTIRFIAWRFLAFVFTLLFILLITNLVFYVIPGDPARVMLGPNARDAEVQALRISLGLDRPWIKQFISYFTALLQGDFGDSLRFSVPVMSLLRSRIPLTLMMAFQALLISLLIGTPLAVFASRRPGSLIDTAVTLITQTALAVPSFFAAILLTLLLGVLFRNFDGILYVPPTQGFLVSMRSLFIPSLAVAIPRIAWVVQFFRQSLIEQQEMDYVRTAAQKGMSSFRLLRKHLLRNALVPLITAVGIMLAELVAGSIVVEQVYNLPGMGRLLITAIEARDFPLTQGIILIIAFLVVAVGFVIDLLNRAVDPRIGIEWYREGGTT